MTQQMTRPPGTACQSCAMPMQEASDFGTEADGSQAEEYCQYCYQNGAFTSDISMEEMIEISAKGMTEATGTPEGDAKELLARILPELKRWRVAA